MENRFSHLIFACVAGMLAGCYNPKRDLSIDPYNTPIIHILDAAYDAPAGMVVVQWEYLGQKRVENFVLERREVSGFKPVKRSVSANAHGQYATLGAFRDGDLLAGEHMQYRVVAEYRSGGLVRTPAVKVPIPGAGLREIRRDPVALAVQVVWQAGDGVAAYEVVRTPLGGDIEIIFATQDPRQTSFWDRSIADNRPYDYAIWSRLSMGVQLTSRRVRVQFYREGGRHFVETLHGGGERMRLSAADSEGEADMLALVGRGNQISLSRLRHTLNVDMPDMPHISRRLVGISFFQLSDLVPQSLDLAGPSLTGLRVAFPRAYIGGLNAVGRVVVVGIALENRRQVWFMPDNWVSQSSQVRLAHDDQQRVYVATDGQLRVYSAGGDPMGTFDLENGDPVDIAVQNGVLWAAWANRVQRGILHFSGGVLENIAWVDVLLQPQSKPLALTLNAAGQAFVLDRTRVRAFKADGTALIAWLLPSGAYAAGDLTIGGSARNLVHLSDENGEVITYVP